MNGKIGNKSKRISIAELKDYLSKRKCDKYIFSSMLFDVLDILFNPNKIFLHNANRISDADSQYVVIERAKYAYIEEFETGIIIDITCGSISTDIDNHTYTVVAEKITK